MPTTNEEFKKMALGITRGTEEGDKFYGQMMALAGGFDAWTSAAAQAQQKLLDDAKAAAEKTKGFEIQIMELTGDKVGALAAKRQIELSSLSAGDQLLQQRIYALTDEAAAIAAANAVSAQRFTLESQLAQLGGDNTLARVAEL